MDRNFVDKKRAVVYCNASYWLRLEFQTKTILPTLYRI